MSDYTKITNYAAKDLLLHLDPAKAIKGTEVGAEFDSIATMSATKTDKTTLAASGGSALVGYLPAGTGAVPTTVQSKLRESVSVLDFGAKCDWDGATGTPDAVAVQAAVDYCIANKKNLIVPSKCLLETTIYIDRQGDTYDAFNMFTISGGGFVVNSDMAMFDTRLHWQNYTDPNDPHTYWPASQNIQFLGTTFESRLRVDNRYVLGSGLLMRMQFQNCSFSYIKFINIGVGYGGNPVLAQYIQEIYLIGCSIRSWDGPFLKSTYVVYDLNISNCQVGDGGIFLEIGSVAGGKITNNVINGCSYVLKAEYLQGVEISGNYHEGMTSYDYYVARDVLGTTFSGNHLISYLGTTYTCAWAKISGIVSGLNSYGNYHNGYMHDIPAGTPSTRFISRDYCSHAVNISVPPEFATLDVTQTTGKITNFGSARLSTTDSRNVATSGGAVPFINIGMGTTSSGALISVVCSATLAGVAALSQVATYTVLRSATGAMVLTQIIDGNVSGIRPFAAAVSGDNIVLSYAVYGATTNKYTTNVEVQAVDGAGETRVYPSITVL